MILLMDQMTRHSTEMMKSLRACGVDCPAVSILYDGFLPEGVLSPYAHYIGDEGKEGKPLYFNRLPVSPYQEIKADGNGAEVLETGKLRGKVYYAQPREKRYVRIFDHLDEHGKVRWSDHFNYYGRMFAQTTLNENQRLLIKTYFDCNGEACITENFATGHVILKKDGREIIFTNKTDFVLYYLEDAGFDLDKILYNSLSTPFFVSQALHRKGVEGRDVLFWQEDVKDEIPGNMQAIFREGESRTEKIAVLYRPVYEKMQKMELDQQRFGLLGYHYDFLSENSGSNEIAIFTNSDNVLHLEKLVQELPEFIFHVAAVTEMSSKLMDLDKYENVRIYPNVRKKKVEDIRNRVSYLLDINDGKEILDAADEAFLRNHLILAFKETLHNEYRVAPKNIFSEKKVEKLIAALKECGADQKKLQARIELQKEQARCESADSYALFLGLKK